MLILPRETVAHMPGNAGSVFYELDASIYITAGEP